MNLGEPRVLEVVVCAEWLNGMNAEYPPVASRFVENWLAFLGRMPSLLLGQFLFSLGVVANLNAGLGGRPWDVLCVGVMGYTPFTLGRVAQLLSLVVLVFGWALGYPPGFSTVTNTYFIGVFIDLIIAWDVVPFPTEPFSRLGLLVFAIGLFAAGSLFYLRVGLGAGPRDGLMMGLVRRLDSSISRVRGGDGADAGCSWFPPERPHGGGDHRHGAEPRSRGPARVQSGGLRLQEHGAAELHPARKHSQGPRRFLAALLG